MYASEFPAYSDFKTVLDLISNLKTGYHILEAMKGRDNPIFFYAPNIWLLKIWFFQTAPLLKSAHSIIYHLWILFPLPTFFLLCIFTKDIYKEIVMTRNFGDQ